MDLINAINSYIPNIIKNDIKNENVHDYFFINFINQKINSITYKGDDFSLYTFIPTTRGNIQSDIIKKYYITSNNLLHLTIHKGDPEYNEFISQIEEHRKKQQEYMVPNTLPIFGDEPDTEMMGGARRRRTQRKHKNRKSRTMKKKMSMVNQLKMW